MVTRTARPLTDSLRQHHLFMLCADYQSYIDCRGQVDHTYRHSHHWSRMSILNVARIRKFSSHRSILDYCENIWQVEPLPVDVAAPAGNELTRDALHKISQPERSHGSTSGKVH